MPRRSAADAARTRKDILAAARKQFTERGYAATTTGELAEAAGVAVGALFRHFDGKPGLFRSVFEELESALDAHVRASAGGNRTLEEFLASAPGRDRSLDVFLTGFRAFLEFARRKDFHRIVMLEGPVVLGETEWHAIEGRRGAATLMDGLEILIAEGVIEDRPRRPLALLLLGAMSEAGFEVARNGASRRNIDGLVDALRYLLTPHLRSKPKKKAAGNP